MEDLIDELVKTRKIFTEVWDEIVKKSENEYLLFHDSEMIRVKFSEDKKHLVVSEQNHEPIAKAHYWNNGMIGDLYRYNRNSDDENTIYEESHFDENGKLDGVKLHYTKTGNLTQKLTYSNGKLHGNAYYYNVSRKLSRVNTYKNGKLDGETRFYHYNGNTKERIMYKNGVKTGETLEFYGNGKLKTEKQYKNGQLDGYVKEYNIKEELKNQYKYREGKIDGSFIEYSDRGYVQGNYKNDKLHGYVQDIDNFGNLISEKRYENGELETVEFTIPSKKRRREITDDISLCINNLKEYGDKKCKIYIEIDEIKE